MLTQIMMATLTHALMQEHALLERAPVLLINRERIAANTNALMLTQIMMARLTHALMQEHVTLLLERAPVTLFTREMIARHLNALMLTQMLMATLTHALMQEHALLERAPVLLINRERIAANTNALMLTQIMMARLTHALMQEHVTLLLESAPAKGHTLLMIVVLEHLHRFKEPSKLEEPEEEKVGPFSAKMTYKTFSKKHFVTILFPVLL